jgi:colicin import membrane protein
MLFTHDMNPSSTLAMPSLTPPRDKRWPVPLLLALLAHGLLVAALTWGVNWQHDNPPTVVQAELWSHMPQSAAPRAVDEGPVVGIAEPVTALPSEPNAEPISEPTPEPTPPAPAPPIPQPDRAAEKAAEHAVAAKRAAAEQAAAQAKAQAQAQAQADIALEKKRQQEEKKKEAMRQQQAHEAQLKAQQLAQKEADARKAAQAKREQQQAKDRQVAQQSSEQAAKDKAQREQAAKAADAKTAKAKAEQAQQAARERQAEEKAQAQHQAQLAKDRADNLRRIQGMAGATGEAGSTGTAKRSSGPSASYTGRIISAVRPNIVFTENPSDNPTAEVEVRTLPDGTVASRRIVKSSGLSSWDDAVLKALDRTARLPRDVDGRVPGTLIITFRVKE